MGDYPEHLNPFKRSGGIRGSFRSIKSAIGGRFRRKKDNNLSKHSGEANGGATLRHQHDQSNGTNGTLRSLAVSELFPRSRFNERVARAQTFAPNSANPENDPNNPFNGTLSIQNGIAGSDSGKLIDASKRVRDGTDTTGRIKRRKKRAPLPPGGSTMLTVPGDHNNSQWSISSYETDCSSATYYTHSENEVEGQDNPERLKDIQEVSKQIQMLCVDDENKSTVSIAETDSNNDEAILKKEQSNPTLVITADNENISNNIINETENDTASNPIVNETPTHSSDILQNDQTTIKENEIGQSSYDDIVQRVVEVDANDNNNIVECKINNNKITQQINDNGDEDKDASDVCDGPSPEPRPSDSVEIERVNDDDINCNGNEIGNDGIICDTHKDIVDEVETKDSVDSQMSDNKSDSNEVTTESETQQTEQNNNKIAIVDDDQDVDNHKTIKDTDVEYVQHKSIYIAGSVDNLDATTDVEIQYNESNTLFITGSHDQLDVEKADDGQRPTPKIRKHKLSKDILLGSSDILNVSP